MSSINQAYAFKECNPNENRVGTAGFVVHNDPLAASTTTEKHTAKNVMTSFPSKEIDLLESYDRAISDLSWTFIEAHSDSPSIELDDGDQHILFPARSPYIGKPEKESISQSTSSSSPYKDSSSVETRIARTSYPQSLSEKDYDPYAILSSVSDFSSNKFAKKLISQSTSSSSPYKDSSSVETRIVRTSYPQSLSEEDCDPYAISSSVSDFSSNKFAKKSISQSTSSSSPYKDPSSVQIRIARTSYPQSLSKKAYHPYVTPFSVFEILRNAVSIDEKTAACPACRKQLNTRGRSEPCDHFFYLKNKQCYLDILVNFGLSYKMAVDSYPYKFMVNNPEGNKNHSKCKKCNKKGKAITIFMHVIKGECSELKNNYRSMIAWIDIEEPKEELKPPKTIAEVKYLPAKTIIKNPLDKIISFGISKQNEKQCINCKKVLANRDNLRSHIMLINECKNYTFNRYGISETHHVTYLSPETYLMGESKCPSCKGCGKILSSRREGIRHVVSHPCNELKKIYSKILENMVVPSVKTKNCKS